MTNDLTVNQPASIEGEIISPGSVSLNTDEETVLMIAAQGESMIPMGRWEGPVLRLAQLGLLHKNDRFNYSITAAGRARAGQAMRESDRALAEIMTKKPEGKISLPGLNSPVSSEGAEILLNRLCDICDRAFNGDAAAKDDALTMIRDGLGVLRQKISLMRIERTL